MSDVKKLVLISLLLALPGPVGAAALQDQEEAVPATLESVADGLADRLGDLVENDDNSGHDGLDEVEDAVDEAIRREVPESDFQIQLSYAPLVKRTAPAVVNIYTRRVVEVRSSPFCNDPFFAQLMCRGQRSGGQERVQGSLGSGVIVGEDGIVVTNYHVIGEADEITVVLADRREFQAEVIAADEQTDLAVIRIDMEGEILPVLKFADSDAVQVGDLVLAIGNPFGVGQTVTSGIVSANARTNAGISDYQFFIQTDAAVNPGNSGGALVAMSGELLGINTAIYSRSGGSNGIGFAIPSNMVKTVVEAAVGEGKITRPWLGASGQEVTFELAESLGLERPGGVLINDVYEGGPADLAGISPGDVILAVGGKEVLDSQGLRFRLATSGTEGEVDFLVLREEETLPVIVPLLLPPEEPLRDEIALDGRHPFQGVTVANLSPAYADEIGFDTFAKGVIVIDVERRSPAGRRQFVRPGDILLDLNGQDIGLTRELESLLVEPAEDYIYHLKRGDRTIECGIIGSRSFYCR